MSFPVFRLAVVAVASAALALPLAAVPAAAAPTAVPGRPQPVVPQVKPVQVVSGVLYVNRMPSTTPHKQRNALVLRTEKACIRGRVTASVDVSGVTATVTVSAKVRPSCKTPVSRRVSVSMPRDVVEFVDGVTGKPIPVVESATY